MLPRRRILIPETIPSSAAVNDEAVARWERAVAERVHAPHTVAVNSGRRAMSLILRQLKIGAGDEVIIPAYTLKDLVPLVQDLGARVVPADIHPRSFTIQPAAIEAKLTEKTRAIMVLHTFGTPCDMPPIMDMAQSRHIPVIEDCAHALGTRCGQAMAGSIGHAGFYSFETTKPVNTFGGGMVASRDKALVEFVRSHTEHDAATEGVIESKLKALRMEEFLFRTNLCVPMLALLATPLTKAAMERLYRRFQHAPPTSVRYSPRQASLGLANLPGLEARIAARARAVEYYRQLLDPSITIQAVPDDGVSTWYFLVVRLPCRAAPVRRRLLWRGIDAGVEDEIADDCAALLGADDCPVTADVYRHALALPMFDGIPEASVARVASALNKLL